MGDNIYTKIVGQSTTKLQKIRLEEKEERTPELTIPAEELRSKERPLPDIIEFLPDATLAIDVNGYVIIWNEANEKMTGIPAKEMIGKGDYAYAISYYGEARPMLLDLVFLEDEEIMTKYPNLTREGDALITEVYFPALYNNKGAWIFAKASPLHDQAGNIIGAIESFRDITATKNANKEKEKRAAELVIANKELAFQNEEKEKRAAELVIADKELAFEVGEKADRAAELVIADKELAFEVGEKADRAAELVIANKELAFKNEEKEKRVAELIIANKELAFQNEEKEKRAAELIIANKELAFEVGEKADRAAELVIANKELTFQKEEKANRAAELVIADKELAFEVGEKADRAAELVIADQELAFEVGEKADRAAELVIANKELAFQNEEKRRILHLSFYDQLTGIYNRRFYVEELKRLDTKRNLPLSLIMGDVNGLKLINDSFGHTVGDELIKKAAQVMKKGCRSDDIIARHGGDEFVIILPKTNGSETEEIINRIKTLSLEEKIGGVDISIAFGYATKEKEKENIQETFKKAEAHMYRNKLCESPSRRGKTIELIMNSLYEKSNREQLHSKRVSEICELIAVKMNFAKEAVIQIRTAGLMHDIGKIGINDKILNSPQELTTDEWKEIKKHPNIGYHILSSMNELSEIADQILQHHEQWNGEGYPKGLKGEEILLQARIITIAEAFDAMTSDWSFRKALNEEEAINEIKRCSGTKFDPTISRIFIEKVLGKDWETNNQ